MNHRSRLFAALLTTGIFAFCGARLDAQGTEIGVTAGALSSPYTFSPAYTYPGALYVFAFDGSYNQANALLGADLLRSVSRHWQFRVGLRGFLSGYHVETDLMWSSEFNSNGGYEPSLPNERFMANHLFLEIPLQLRYLLFPDKKFGLYAEAGFSTNYYLSTWISQRVEGNAKNRWERNSDVRPVNLSLDVAAGAQLRLGEKRTLFLQPVLRFPVSDVEKTDGKNGVSVGLETGLRWRLRDGK